jgi:hypothetical protein
MKTAFMLLMLSMSVFLAESMNTTNYTSAPISTTFPTDEHPNTWPIIGAFMSGFLCLVACMLCLCCQRQRIAACCQRDRIAACCQRDRTAEKKIEEKARQRAAHLEKLRMLQIREDALLNEAADAWEEYCRNGYENDTYEAQQIKFKITVTLLNTVAAERLRATYLVASQYYEKYDREAIEEFIRNRVPSVIVGDEKEASEEESSGLFQDRQGAMQGYATVAITDDEDDENDAEDGDDEDEADDDAALGQY